MKRLISLKMDGEGMGIKQDQISVMNLVKLSISFNYDIVDLNHMTNLRKLETYCEYKLGPDGIKSLNLTWLSLENNASLITDVSHFTNLRYLDISGSMVNQYGIRGLNPRMLYIMIIAISMI